MPLDETPFRFSRIAPETKTALDPSVLQHLARMMVRGLKTLDSSGPPIPAGFTYLGQFVTHDMSFNRTPPGDPRPVEEMVQGRSPSLDLDSLYGAGPDIDPALYQNDRARLKIGTTAPSSPTGGGDREFPGYDLPRLGVGATKAERQRALIADLRNDENLMVAQMHLAFVRFHNRVVADLSSKGVPADTRWDLAREIVTKHYQWVVRWDFLPRILDGDVLDDVWRNRRRFFEKDADPKTRPTMPVEFASAAFRLHSMVRDTYELNRIFQSSGPGPVATLGLLRRFSGAGGNLSPDGDWDDPETGSFERLPSSWIVDWRRFFDFGEAGIPGMAPPPKTSNVAKRIDTRLADPLSFLSLGSLLQHDPTPPARRNLAYRTLAAGAEQKLATGQEMAKLFRIEALSEEMLEKGDSGVIGDPILSRAGVFKTTPLWFYILREAELGGGRLGGVGARIVAETFHRSIEGSEHSIVRERDWLPHLGRVPKTFRMVDLLWYAFEDKPGLLNPLGDS